MASSPVDVKSTPPAWVPAAPRLLRSDLARLFEQSAEALNVPSANGACQVASRREGSSGAGVRVLDVLS